MKEGFAEFFRGRGERFWAASSEMLRAWAISARGWFVVVAEEERAVRSGEEREEEGGVEVGVEGVGVIRSSGRGCDGWDHGGGLLFVVFSALVGAAGVGGAVSRDFEEPRRGRGFGVAEEVLLFVRGGRKTAWAMSSARWGGAWRRAVA